MGRGDLDHRTRAGRGRDHRGARRAGVGRDLAALLIVALAGVVALGSARDARAADRKSYLEDYEFIVDTVQQHGAAVRSKKIDWKKEAARLRSQFAACESDADHVKNVMELLALLHDSHTSVTRSSVGWDGLPGRFDGLYGAALWFGWDEGKLVVRGLRDGHTLESSVPRGSILVSIGGQPAWLAMAQEERRIARSSGISSRHSLYGALSNRLLPFGDAQSIRLGFLRPDGKDKEVDAPRWSSDGRAFVPMDVELPEGIESGEGAMSGWIGDPRNGVGYLRITGKMDDATATAFHAAFDALNGMRGLILDGRWMGGGADNPAWDMAGRLYPEGVDNGSNGRIEPSGDWQFDGPVVFLQNETMVSSAETFTWAVSEPGRVISVGRPTGGWSIIPRGYSCPSGLVDFRLGVTDRGTPIQGIKTEGVGYPPDVLLPFGPVFCEATDPAREIGLEILTVLLGGVEREAAREAYASLFEGDVDGFRKTAASFEKKVDRYDPDRIAKRVLDDLEQEIEMEQRCLGLKGDMAPDLVGLERRLPRLELRARQAGLGGRFKALEKAFASQAKERKAQEALLELIEHGELDDAKARKAFLTRHGKTDVGRIAAERLFQ